MEIRAAATRYSDPTVEEAAAASPDYGTTGRMIAAPQVRRTSLTRGRTVNRPVLLTQQQEYNFIRADLRHLLITAAALFLIMIVLLLIFD
jgi:hypothetical protein